MVITNHWLNSLEIGMGSTSWGDESVFEGPSCLNLVGFRSAAGSWDKPPAETQRQTLTVQLQSDEDQLKCWKDTRGATHTRYILHK